MSFATGKSDEKERVITLTKEEEDLLNRIQSACEEIPELKSTQIRLAGGWVRDKLMGRESSDMDIALDNIKGELFANLLRDYCKDKYHEEFTVGVIQENPEQSKHLATATFKLCGVSIDANNLRAEEYADTRIPTVRIGTPEEDALRRDFTINSLFFNVNTRNVEDWSGKGLSDLKAGIVRTPLAPDRTFRDDPLRVLRAARFAGRYGFSVDHELEEAASAPVVHELLKSKVSRERIGIEVKKMLSEGETPVESLRLLCKWGLRDVVFRAPDNMALYDPWPAELPPRLFKLEEYKVDDATRLCLGLAELMQRTLVIGRPQMSPDNRRLLLLSAFLTPFYGYMHPLKKGTKTEPVIEYIIKDSLKLPVKDLAARVVEITRSAHFFVHEARKFVKTQQESKDRSAGPDAVRLELGRHVHSEIQTDWSLAMDLALVLEQASLCPMRKDCLNVPLSTALCSPASSLCDPPAIPQVILFAAAAAPDGGSAGAGLKRAPSGIPSALNRSPSTFGGGGRTVSRPGSPAPMRRRPSGVGQALADGSDGLIGAGSIPEAKQRRRSDGKHVHSHGPIVNTVEVLRDWFEFDSKLVGCWSWKPWLEGNELMELFGISRGPAVKHIVMLLRDWRLLHPMREERKEAVLECVLWMAKQWKEAGNATPSEQALRQTLENILAAQASGDKAKSKRKAPA